MKERKTPNFNYKHDHQNQADMAATQYVQLNPILYGQARSTVADQNNLLKDLCNSTTKICVSTRGSVRTNGNDLVKLIKDLIVDARSMSTSENSFFQQLYNHQK